jgi:hypothetical protein
MGRHKLFVDGKPIDGSALSAQLMRLRKSNLKRTRSESSFKRIPLSIYQRLMVLGRARYMAIVVVTILSLLWDGWASRKKSKRVPKMEVMVTRRMLHTHFGLGESSAGSALSAMVELGMMPIAQESVFSGKRGKNLGRLYRLPWMEKPAGKKIQVYWGLIVSEQFLSLSVTLQAVLILLHQFHSREHNRLTIRPCALKGYGVNRNLLPKYIGRLIKVGLLNYLEDDYYEFMWFDDDGKPNFNKLKIMHLSHTDTAPK